MATQRICSVEGCGKRHRAQSLCKTHYDFAFVPRKRDRALRPAGPRVCSIVGCGKKHRSNGLCVAHYNEDYARQKRMHRNPGDPNAANPQRGLGLKELHAAIESKTDDCILWKRSVDAWGYPRLYLKGKRILAHRQACIIAHGPPPSSSHVTRHLCHTPRCVNPRHLKWGTPKENTADMMLAGRQYGQRRCKRLTRNEQREIAASSLSIAKLATIYQVSRTTIFNTRRRWRRASVECR